MKENIESICRSCFHSCVCEQFNEHRNSLNEKCHFFNDHFVSAADVVERKRGEWVDISCVVHDPDGDWIATQYQCSLCGRKEYRKEPFCNCGADMREVAYAD